MSDDENTNANSDEEDEWVHKNEHEGECEICGGKGYIPITEDHPEYKELEEKWGRMAPAYMTKKQCKCLQEEQFHRWVGDPIYEAERLSESPLFGREDDNLFITAQRPDMLAHLRYVLSHHDFTYFWRLTTDSRLRDIFVGNSEDYSSVTAYAGPPDLFVIQLAVLSYKNKAMGGTILEALRTRQFEGKSTWIVNPYDEPFEKGHLAWTPELDYFIEENFEKIELPKRAEGPTIGTEHEDNDSKKRPDIQDNIQL